MAYTSPIDSVHGSPEGDSVPSQEPFLHLQNGQLRGWYKAPNDKCYSSFGDRGTTATVNAYGNIIQFSTTIKEVASGIAIADHARMAEPYEVHKRTSEILELAEEKCFGERTYGFCLDELIADSLPSLTYVNYRWPRFAYPKNQKGISTTVQWVVFEETVLQQCTVTNEDAESHVKFRFTEGMGIRDVDYLDPYHYFNESDEGSIERGDSNASSWIRFNQLYGPDNTDQTDQKGYIAVVVSLFVDGKILQWDPNLSWGLDLQKGQCMEIVFAYRMLYTPVAQNSSKLSIPERVTTIGKVLRDEPFSNEFRLTPSTSPDSPIDCIKSPTGIPSVPTVDHLEYLLHSFALQFIIESAKRIRSLSNGKKYDNYADSLLERITTVCKGHLCWLLCTQKTASGVFAANYWISGGIMKKADDEWWHPNESWVPDDSVTDTAVQLIKMKACLEFLEISHSELQPVIGDITRHWLDDLEHKQPRGAYVWPHSKKGDTKYYRLDDNVWVWKALKDIELGHFLTHATNTSSPYSSKLRKKDAYLEVQQAVLRRFTTENSILRQRMLAVSRSSRDTRFLFHARDTVLFHAKDWEFILPETNFAEVWKNTIDVQKYHEENQEIRWDNALRYALSICMACDGFSINRKSTSDIIKGSLHVLINSSSPNGLLMGQLDETSKKPTVFVNERDRDFYFHSSFEIPFILLTRITEILGLLGRHSKTSGPDVSSGPDRSDDTTTTLSQRLPQSIFHSSLANRDGELTLVGPGTNDGFVTSNAHHSNTASSKLNRPMKKTIPFNDWVEARSVVELDDEWLFNHPAFFSEGQDRSNIFCTDIHHVHDDILKSGMPLGGSIEQAVEEWRELLVGRSTSEDIKSLIENRSRRVTLVDIAKKKKSRGKKNYNGGVAHKDIELSNAELWNRLVQPRTTELAKKRFVWLRAPNHQTALLSFAGSPKNESIPMSLFFDLHVQAEQHFSEDTTMYLNTWETEIHLSFYQLIQFGEEPESGGLAHSLAYPLPVSFVKEPQPPSKRYRVCKASTGFRFVGDFFDRFWTCHFIEYIPVRKKFSDQGSIEFSPGSPETSTWDFKFKPSAEDRSWTQRKVLELYLFERMLTRLVESTREIFDKLQENFKYPWAAFTPWAEFATMDLDETNYFLSSRHWQSTQNFLKVVADRMEHTNDVIVRWESREKDRAAEQPRWTRYDEGKHRRSINKLQISTNGKIREFRTLHAKINSFRDSLITRQDQIRNDIALRGSENIRFFTYVTVVFLPLGFASSIFSMSAVPDHALVKNMVIFALVALIITVLAVLYAQAVLQGIAKILGRIRWIWWKLDEMIFLIRLKFY
ncbi:hypothetical protein E8E14_009896 [Neopestalotiopsis sp. 37M]|nr:hypothetical protein E8E14_009896 [Neopestalotiopsis sp. 37M]